MPQTFPIPASLSNASTPMRQIPAVERHQPLQYVNADGSTAVVCVPICWDELYNLKGRLLTLIDATFPDREQRKAQKDIVWQTLREWMTGIEKAGDYSAGGIDAALTRVEQAIA